MIFPCNADFTYPTIEPQLYHQGQILGNPAPAKSSVRIWNKDQIESLFKTTKYYSMLTNKPLESLRFEDFTVIGAYYGVSPLKCMKKIREICVTGSLAAGAWSGSEDEYLVKLVNSDLKKWGKIAELLNKNIHNSMKIRSGKQCKERWVNHLDPNMKRDKWTQEEDLAILKLHKTMGHQWSKISKIIGNRTDSAIKNRVKSLVNKQKQDLDARMGQEVSLEGLIEKLELGLSKN